jgi:hypothetical protein
MSSAPRADGRGKIENSPAARRRGRQPLRARQLAQGIRHPGEIGHDEHGERDAGPRASSLDQIDAPFAASTPRAISRERRSGSGTARPSAPGRAARARTAAVSRCLVRHRGRVAERRRTLSTSSAAQSRPQSICHLTFARDARRRRERDGGDARVARESRRCVAAEPVVEPATRIPRAGGSPPGSGRRASRYLPDWRLRTCSGGDSTRHANGTSSARASPPAAAASRRLRPRAPRLPGLVREEDGAHRQDEEPVVPRIESVERVEAAARACSSSRPSARDGRGREGRRYRLVARELGARATARSDEKERDDDPAEKRRAPVADSRGEQVPPTPEDEPKRIAVLSAAGTPPATSTGVVRILAQVRVEREARRPADR